MNDYTFRFAIAWKNGRTLHAELFERESAFQGASYVDNRTWFADTATVENVALAFDVPTERVLLIDTKGPSRFAGFKGGGNG